MTVAAVYDAVTIARLSVEAALKPLVLTQQAGVGVPRVYWKLQTANIYPCVIHHSQDRGGQNASFLATGRWSGLWTVQAFATDPAVAEAWYAAIRPGMDSLALPSGYTGYSIQAIFDTTLDLGTDKGMWPAGAIWEILITRV